MKLRAWLAAWWQTILRDLFGEGDEAGADRPRGSTSRERAADDRLNALLAEAQTRLDDLQTQRRAAVARRKRVELAWQAALAEVNRLDAAVDAALLEGEESQARRHLAAQQLEAWERSASAWKRWRGRSASRIVRPRDQVELRRRQEQIAQAEDRMAARREVAQARPRTEESSWR
ncbi:MAG: hypothetical protein IPM84_20030 [Anaerolineae bacterium]|nr:hypothetical protein [Anaerolineae bacterium]